MFCRSFIPLFVFLAVRLSAATVTTTLDNTHSALGRTSTGVYDPINVYKAPGGFGVAFLLPPLVIELPRGGFDGGIIDYNKVLKNSFKNPWDFKAAGADLAKNSLEVTAYDVIGTAAVVGIDGQNNVPKKGGGKTNTRGFAVRYTGAAQANPHWVQVIADNHNITNNPGHGNPENIVDSAGTTPYYDDGGAANGTNFYDNPRRSDPTKSHYWVGALYYASAKGPGLGAQEVTIINGMLWGWANIFFPVGDKLGTFIVEGSKNFDSVSNLSSAINLDVTPFFTDSQLAEYKTEFNQEVLSLPEPNAFLMLGTGLLMIGIWRRRGY